MNRPGYGGVFCRGTLSAPRFHPHPYSIHSPICPIQNAQYCIENENNHILKIEEYIKQYILTDMNKVLVVLDDECSKVLERQKNKSRFIRESIKYMSMYITTDTIAGMRESYALLLKATRDMDSKLDYIAGKVQGK